MWRRLAAYKNIGIVNIVQSMTGGKGSTETILKTVKNQFCFMGIAARKWINTEPLLESIIKKVAARNRTMRFLLLNPDSPEAIRLSQIEHGNPDVVPEAIRDSLRNFKALREKGYNVDVKLYSCLPIFRIAIVNNETAYVGFYRAGTDGSNSPQLILSSKANITYFQPFTELFNDTWDRTAVDVDWDQY